MQELFPPTFVQGIRQLRIVARHAIRGHDRGEHASRRAGVGMEFRDFRPYVPGDDLRRVDWHAFRRTGRLFLRLFDEPLQLNVHVLLDVSQSMFFELPPRADTGRRIAAALAAAAASQHDRVSIYPFGNRLGQPVRLTATGGLAPLLSSLARLEPMGETDLCSAAAQLTRLGIAPGLVVVVSDFFDPAGIDAVTTALGRLQHRLGLVQIVRKSDERPDLAGDLEIVDCENDSALHVTATEASVSAYRTAYEAFQGRIHAFAVGRNALLVRVDADEPILPQINRLFEDGTLRL